MRRCTGDSNAERKSQLLEILLSVGRRLGVPFSAGALRMAMKEENECNLRADSVSTFQSQIIQAYKGTQSG